MNAKGDLWQNSGWVFDLSTFRVEFKKMADSGLSLNINQLIDEATRCVKCALCLPGCPTYQLQKNEASSPRGRIALMQAWLQGDLPLNTTLSHHFDSCLMCRSCEGACPSGVKYGRLMDGVRVIQRESLGRWGRFKSWLFLTLLSNRRIYTYAEPLLHVYQKSGISMILRYGLSNRLKRLESMLPRLRTPADSIREQDTSSRIKKQRVLLFTGCVGQLFEREVQLAAVTLLDFLGCEVEIPGKQFCCGAMHRHRGDSQSADRLIEQNRTYLSDAPFDALLSIATGCCAELVEQGGFSLPVSEIDDYLAQLDWPKDTILQPLNARVVIHEPCSSFYGGFNRQAVPLLLQKIPQLQIITFGDDRLCCGAAGSYMLTEPETSRQLQQLKVEVVKKLHPDILVTNNTGCALQLRSGFREAGLDIEVLHPVQLLARQLQVI